MEEHTNRARKKEKEEGTQRRNEGAGPGGETDAAAAAAPSAVESPSTPPRSEWNAIIREVFCHFSRKSNSGHGCKGRDRKGERPQKTQERRENDDDDRDLDCVTDTLDS